MKWAIVFGTVICSAAAQTAGAASSEPTYTQDSYAQQPAYTAPTPPPPPPPQQAYQPPPQQAYQPPPQQASQPPPQQASQPPPQQQGAGKESMYKDRATARHLKEMHPDQHHEVHHEFRRCIAAEDSKQLEELAKFGVDIHAPYHEEDGNAIHEAVMSGKVAAMEQLVKLGVNPDHLDRRGRSPMYWAAENNDVKTAEALVKAGAKIMGGKDSDGQSALRRAISNRKPEMAELLLKHGADVHVKNRNGGCSLDAARARWQINGDPHYLKLLLQYRSTDGHVKSFVDHLAAQDPNLAAALGTGTAMPAGARQAPPTPPPQQAYQPPPQQQAAGAATGAAGY